jgi:Sulfotransferase family
MNSMICKVNKNSWHKEIEHKYFEQYSSPDASKPVFIIASPRTGSTIFYQALIHFFNLPYISNLTEKYFHKTPIVGFVLQNDFAIDVGWDNSYGKIKGLFSPSEGSFVVANWFGGGHPSQVVSAKLLQGQRKHFLSTMAAVEGFAGRPLLLKNAWNCFRLESLHKHLSGARFIWLRRDIAAASISDLRARLDTKGSLHEWNSATPANYAELTKKEPYKQVVENQFEFNKAISSFVYEIAPHKCLEVWYEDFISDPESEMLRVGRFIKQKTKPIKTHGLKSHVIHGKTGLDDQIGKIYKYVDSKGRIEKFKYHKLTA